MDTPFAQIEKDSSGFMRAGVIAAMAELDVATALLILGNSATFTETARQCGCDARGMKSLLDALVALGYFSKDGSGKTAKYAVLPQYVPLLDSRETTSYVPMLRHRARLQRHWSRLSWAVRDGKPQKEHSPSFLGEAQDGVSFIAAMNAIALRLTTRTMDALEKAGLFDSLPPDARILDIGGASGTYTEAFLRRLPKAAATIFDLPAGIAGAKHRFENSDMEARVQLLEGDFTRRGFPDRFDFAWISAIIHQLGREECRSLFRKTFDALKPGAIVAIRDFVMDAAGTSPEAGTLFGINMLVGTARGRVYTFDEISGDLTESGFRNVVHAVHDPTMSAVVTAEKPK
ncbi:MAG: methyltransferase domain-containing protein [Desulfovibrio sp.]|nr:methyltransferase domain-containing protein [Desulfovibrio sp.]